MVNAPVAAQEFANLQLLDFIFKSDVWYRTKRSRFRPTSEFGGLCWIGRAAERDASGENP